MDAHVEPRKKAAHNAMPHANDMCALGELICRLNPYTKLPKDPTTGLTTAGMRIQGPPATALAPATQPLSVDQIIANITVEVVRDYGATWTFKGKTFGVKTAVRIPYRFEVTTDSGETYWQEESLLIGFAGGEGPG